MKILSIDTSTMISSCSVMDEGIILGDYNVNQKLTHSETLVPMVKDLLEKLNIKLEEIDLYVVGKSEGIYTQRSDIINIKKEYSNLENIQDYKVENLEGNISDDGNVNISWDKLENFDCTYSVYVRNNIISPNGGFELYQHGISENKISIPVDLTEDINIDVYVIANSSQGSSKSSNILNLEKKKTDTEIERSILQIKNPENTF